MIQAEIPSGLDTAAVNLILNRVKDEKKTGARVAHISSVFLGRPYIIGPLEGDQFTEEVFKVSLDGFDCVTYVETVLALAQAMTVDEFINAIREIRYEGEVNWPSRNHYMVDWARNNERRGIIRNLTSGALTIEKTRTLNAVNGLPQREVTFRCFPKRNLSRLRSLIQTGDLILFASTRKTLDVFHTGLVIKNDEIIQLRHAALGAGKVVEQPLAEFLDAHRMSGFILLRPL